MNETTLLQLAREHIQLTGGNAQAAPIDADTALREANEMAERAAIADAQDAITIARESTEPVCFITGNSYMPPLRAFGRAEDFWAASHEVDNYMLTPWEVYVETFDRTIDDASVLMECPEYDNALYVVDIARFEYIGDERDDADIEDSLSADWREIPQDNIGMIPPKF